MGLRQIELLFDVKNTYRARARRILSGVPQGIINPVRLAQQRAYQNAYRKAHRKAANAAAMRYDRKCVAEYGSSNSRTNRCLRLAAAQQRKIANRKELYAAIERQFDPSGRGGGLQKLFQLSINFGARRKKDSECKWRGRPATAKRTMDLLEMSKIKRRASKGKKANGGKVRDKVPTAKDLH